MWHLDFYALTGLSPLYSWICAGFQTKLWSTIYSIFILNISNLQIRTATSHIRAMCGLLFVREMLPVFRVYTLIHSDTTFSDRSICLRKLIKLIYGYTGCETLLTQYVWQLWDSCPIVLKIPNVCAPFYLIWVIVNTGSTKCLLSIVEVGVV